MPPPNSNRTTPFRNVSERSMSFNGKTTTPSPEKLRRPKTLPDLKSSFRNANVSPPSSGKEENAMSPEKRLTKVLLNVSIQGSIGAVQVIISPELSVGDLIAAAVKQYIKEGRRPVISFANLADFDLHYSQFSLESLNKEEKIANLGSRNFFLCRKRMEVNETAVAVAVTATATSCSKEAEKATNFASQCPPWLKFMSFLF